MMPDELTFYEVTAANVARCDRWHKGGLTDWSVADWAVAMAGEAGEVCNAVKKLRRVEDEIANISDEGRLLATREQAIAKIGEELADTFLYLNLLGVRLGINLADEIVAKFNATSERYGFPERLTMRKPWRERDKLRSALSVARLVLDDKGHLDVLVDGLTVRAIISDAFMTYKPEERKKGQQS